MTDRPDGLDWTLLDGGMAPLTPEDTAQSLATLRAKRDEAEAQAARGHERSAVVARPGQQRSKDIKRAPLWRWGMGASLTAVVGLMVYIVALHGVLPDRQRGSFHTPREFTQRIYHTGTAQRTTIALSDGSRVTLAPRTTLTVDRDFGARVRGVALQGQAYFDVAHAGGAPFVVRTGAVVTRVLGTTFDVRHYDDDAWVRVVVASGKVTTGGRRKAVVLTNGTVAQVNDSTVTATAVRNVEQLTRWTEGALVFEQTPVPEMLKTVGRWYGVEFRLADSALVGERFTLTLDHKSQAEALRMLAWVLDVNMTFEQTGNGVPIATLHPRRGAARERRGVQETFPSMTEVGR